MRPGELKDRVTIANLVEARDATHGSVSESWVDVGEVWAKVATLSTKETFANDQRMSEVAVKVIIRYRTDISHRLRVTHGSDVYYMEGTPIDIRNEKKYLMLMCRVYDGS